MCVIWGWIALLNKKGGRGLVLIRDVFCSRNMSVLLCWTTLLLCFREALACGYGCWACTDTKCTTCTTGYALQVIYGITGSPDCVKCNNLCESCTMDTYFDTWYMQTRQIQSACARCSAGYYQNPSDTRNCITCGSQCTSCALIGGGCSTCNSGFYSNPNSPTFDCYPCTACTSRQKELWSCGLYGDRLCSNCPSNSRATTYECIACVDRVTYASADQSRCDTCTSCTTAQYLPSGNECTASSNAICVNCADNRASKTMNSLTCNSCVSGYYLSGTTGACVDCATPNCPTNTYIQCASGTRTCVSCTGHTQANACPFGKEPNLICTGTQREDSTCIGCAPGSERLAANVATTLMCVRCGLGKFRLYSQDCLECTNKPASNSIYLTWGNQNPNSNTCPWYEMILFLCFWCYQQGFWV